MFSLDRHTDVQDGRTLRLRKCRSALGAALMGPDLTGHMYVVFRKGWCTGIARRISETAIVGLSRPDARDGNGRRKARHYLTGPERRMAAETRAGLFRLEPVRTPKG